MILSAVGDYLTWLASDLDSDSNVIVGGDNYCASDPTLDRLKLTILDDHLQNNFN